MRVQTAQQNNVTFRTRVTNATDVQIQRRGVYALVSLVLISFEISTAFAAAVFAALEMYNLSTAFTLMTTLGVTIETTLRVREHAAQLHMSVISLKAISKTLGRRREDAEHPLMDEFEAAMTSDRIDYISATSSLCRAPKRGCESATGCSDSDHA